MYHPQEETLAQVCVPFAAPTLRFQRVFSFSLLCSPLSSAKMVLQNDIDLLNPPAELEKRKHKLKRLVQSPNSFFMDVKCQGCFNISNMLCICDRRDLLAQDVTVEIREVEYSATVSDWSNCAAGKEWSEKLSVIPSFAISNFITRSYNTMQLGGAWKPGRRYSHFCFSRFELLVQMDKNLS
ncbi:hypothetical protein Cgig2_030986 [Carnegiea gigantea]|uniref:Uncharacterized protein n=1 Tax=Carnegiea gigantea TaxID=171969 RepID=A0A9Q1QJT7_9CARY|nr:hypothetical protein Cgig2_030986 [Carnegiea gigantea]